MDYRATTKEQAYWGCSAVWWLVGLAVIGMVITVGWYLLRPTLYNLDTQAIRQSNQYVTTQQTQLRQWHAAWSRIDADIAAGKTPEPQGRAQQRAIVDQMRQAADTLQPDQVPPDIAAFIATR